MLAQKPSRHDPKVRVLLVDDQPANLLALEAMLQDVDATLVTARSGEEALKRLLDEDFAAVLLDVRMPGIDGYETARLIRSRDRSRHTPIIFLTAHETSEAVVMQAYKDGAADHLVKPLVPTVLRAKVAGFVELFRLAEQIRLQADALRDAQRRDAERQLTEEELVAEQAARSAAEANAREAKRAKQTLQFLADASDVLFDLIDYQSTLQRVARLAVPFFADWCVVDIIGQDGQLAQVAAAHADPSQEPLLQQLGQPTGVEPSPSWTVARVVETGQSELVPELTAAAEMALGRDPEQVAVIRQLVPRSFLCVALRIRGRTLGAFRFVLSASGRHYGPADLAVAEDLARRMATAIDNARLYEQVRDADRRKDEFLAMLAHELRNPLAPLRNALHILQAPPADPAVVARTVQIMNRQVQHMIRLVDDLLDVARIVRGKIELRKEPVDIAAVFKRAIETAQPLIDAQAHQLTVSLPDEPVWLEADPVRLAQVIANLLNNAAKYTEPGGSISLTAEREGSELLVGVRDTGMGIAPELLHDIFELFTQAERSIERSQGGLGIGLTLVRRLVEMHGGSIHAFSEGAGQGSEFIVRLPILQGQPEAPEDEPALANETAEAIHAGPFRILVVDDNADAAESVAMIVKLSKHDVQVAHDGQTALEVAKVYRPHIVLLDIGLPGMNGYEAAKRLRQDPNLANTLLVAMTGYGRQEDQRRSHEAGFDHHLVKPVDVDVIQGLLTRPTGRP